MSLEDVAHILIVGFMLGIFMLFITAVSFNIDGLWTNTTVTQDSKDIVHNTIYNGYDAIWNMFPVVFFGLYFVALILAYNVGSHPIFAVFSLIVAAVDIIVASVLGFVYGQISNATPELLSVIGRYPYVDFIFQNYAFLAAIMAMGMFIVLYHRGTAGGQGGGSPP